MRVWVPLKFKCYFFILSHLKQFVDKECGEWYGYLNQQGEVNMDFKGGAFKGWYDNVTILPT